MTTSAYPKFKVCAAHVAPVFLDATATIEKACSLMAEASRAGARLIAFPESFVPGFPVWASVQAPIKNHDFFKRLAANSIEVPGPEVTALCNAARENAIVVSMASASVRRFQLAACGTLTCWSTPTATLSTTTASLCQHFMKS